MEHNTTFGRVHIPLLTISTESLQVVVPLCVWVLMELRFPHSPKTCISQCKSNWIQEIATAEVQRWPTSDTIPSYPFHTDHQPSNLGRHQIAF